MQVFLKNLVFSSVTFNFLIVHFKTHLLSGSLHFSLNLFNPKIFENIEYI